MAYDEQDQSGILANLFAASLAAIGNIIPRLQDAGLADSLRCDADRLRLWGAGFRVEDGDLDKQMEEDMEMREISLILLGSLVHNLRNG
jgi:hypothetical protein